MNKRLKLLGIGIGSLVVLSAIGVQAYQAGRPWTCEEARKMQGETFSKAVDLITKPTIAGYLPTDEQMQQHKELMAKSKTLQAKGDRLCRN